MKFSRYVRDEINRILAYILFMLFLVWYFYNIGLEIGEIILILILFTSFCAILFILNYIKRRKYIQKIEKTMESLEEKYVIAEIIEKPRNSENLAYYHILKKANKSMLEKVAEAQKKQSEYKEYIESWVHEIKTPITATKLSCENNKSELTGKMQDEIENINNYVEQILFYARMDQVSNDYIIKPTQIQNVINQLLIRNKRFMIYNHIKIELEEIDKIAYTDEKWLEFILNQILQNSIKYKKEEAVISIKVKEEKEHIKIEMRDNGIGIKQSEINRVFEKGFTGTNGRNIKKSTGMGLYLCKKLCTELGMDIKVESKEKEYTTIILILPTKEELR